MENVTILEMKIAIYLFKFNENIEQKVLKLVMKQQIQVIIYKVVARYITVPRPQMSGQ